MFGARCGTLSNSISMPVPARAAVSQVEQVKPAAPMSCMPATAPVASNSRHASHTSFSMKGSPTCTAPRCCSADSFGRAARDLFMAQHAEAKRVHERVAFVTFIEIDLARDGGDAEAIPVMRNARHDAREKPAVVQDFGSGSTRALACRGRRLADRFGQRGLPLGEGAERCTRGACAP